MNRILIFNCRQAYPAISEMNLLKSSIFSWEATTLTLVKESNLQNEGEDYDLLEESMQQGRLRNAHLMNGVRFILITGFVGIYVYAITMVEDTAFRSTWIQIIVLWVIISIIFFWGRRSRFVLEASRFAVPLVDIPAVSWIQYQNVVNSDEPDTTAVFTLAIIICLTAMSSFSLRPRHLILTGGMGVACLLVVYLAAELSVVSLLTGPMLILVTAGMLSWFPRRQNELTREAAERQAKRNRLARHFSPGVAEVIEGRDDPGEGESCEISVLFCDIRDFTGISEKLSPSEVVQLLNEFHGHMVGEVFRFGGTLDKYLGDGLLAYFNAPVRQTDHCLRAVSCALAMDDALEKLNQSRESEGQTLLRIGMGIHAGEAVVGNIGASHRREFTAIGDTVNVASRLQNLTKEYECGILVSKAVVSRIPQAGKRGIVFQEKGTVGVRGRREKLEIFSTEPLEEKTSNSD